MLEAIIKLQTELKAPKSQFNKFGNYSYRSLEDIQEALKPLLYKHGLLLSFMDEVIELGGESFMKCTAVLTQGGEQQLQASSYAAIDFTQKGMSKPQACGSATSYARKYALGAMFLVDDTKDDDATNNHGKKKVTTEKSELKLNSVAYANVIKALSSGQYTIEDVEKKYKLTQEIKTKLENL